MTHYGYKYCPDGDTHKCIPRSRELSMAGCPFPRAIMAKTSLG